MNNNIQEQTKWSENVILVDADYVDKVAFNLIVNFERMLGRRIPQADMAHWLDCVALDGGIRQGDHEIFVVLIHDKGKAAMENFKPGLYADLNEKAFKDQLTDPNISKMSFEDRFGLLVDQEWSSRKNNHLKRLIKRAKFAEYDACTKNIEYHS